MTDEEFAALKADVAERNDRLAEMREVKEAKTEELEGIKADIRTLQKETDPLETQLRTEDRNRAGRHMDEIGLGG